MTEIKIEVGLQILFGTGDPLYIAEVLRVDEAENKLGVQIYPLAPDRLPWVEDDWNLAHTKAGFKRGEYRKVPGVFVPLDRFPEFFGQVELPPSALLAERQQKRKKHYEAGKIPQFFQAKETGRFSSSKPPVSAMSTQRKPEELPLWQGKLKLGRTFEATAAVSEEERASITGVEVVDEDGKAVFQVFERMDERVVPHPGTVAQFIIDRLNGGKLWFPELDYAALETRVAAALTRTPAERQALEEALTRFKTKWTHTSKSFDALGQPLMEYLEDLCTVVDAYLDEHPEWKNAEHVAADQQNRERQTANFLRQADAASKMSTPLPPGAQPLGDGAMKDCYTIDDAPTMPGYSNYFRDGKIAHNQGVLPDQAPVVSGDPNATLSWLRGWSRAQEAVVAAKKPGE